MVETFVEWESPNGSIRTMVETIVEWESPFVVLRRLLLYAFSYGCMVTMNKREDWENRVASFLLAPFGGVRFVVTSVPTGHNWRSWRDPEIP
jgi:hypothetical protein